MKTYTLICFALLFMTKVHAHPGEEAFIQKMTKEYQLSGDFIRHTLAKAKKQQKIIDAMNRPAEGKDWYEYRPIFLTRKRIDEGKIFIEKNKQLLLKAQKDTGVDASVIAAIIGVETYYGKRTGTWKVLDALATLAFYYPKRAAFFQKELGAFLKMAEEEGFDPAEMKGSYAGAMGWGQFMPSSYRMYAVDYNGDSKRDLWDSPADVIGSVANYLKRHHWVRGGKIVSRVKLVSKHKIVPDSGLKPQYTVAEFEQWGYQPESKIKASEKVSLIELKQKQSKDYWFGLQNFYVITRYNHSPLYAMAVTQLAAELENSL